ncbi:hypothetical protein [Actinomyces respiraculi]|uniref:hypothetical protein n=1 Tax=Actinomyces respiraculi TaxID=2744574 RepID=UPI0014219446|nr:hypothetical protein [Actinomyces respiraculi]
MPLPRPARLLRPRRSRATAVPPQSLVRTLDRGTRVLGAVPVDAQGVCWLVSTPAALLTLSATGSADGEGTTAPPLPERLTWDRLSRASWDAEERVITLRLLGEGAERRMQVPAVLRYEVGADARGPLEEVHEVDEVPFLRSLRERVEAMIVHHVSTTLPSGVRLTASVRRAPDGGLYTVLEPEAHSEGVVRFPDEVEALLRRVHDGVGLPTRSDSRGIPPFP